MATTQVFKSGNSLAVKWIAAAIEAALAIVTNNVREFQRVSGLKVMNWVG